MQIHWTTDMTKMCRMPDACFPFFETGVPGLNRHAWNSMTSNRVSSKACLNRDLKPSRCYLPKKKNKNSTREMCNAKLVWNLDPHLQPSASPFVFASLVSSVVTSVLFLSSGLWLNLLPQLRAVLGDWLQLVLCVWCQSPAPLNCWVRVWRTQQSSHPSPHHPQQ